METLNRPTTRFGKFSNALLVPCLSLNLVALGLAPIALAGTPSADTTTSLLIAQGRRRMVFRLNDRGVPVSRVGGAARGGCSSNTPQLQLTAMTPITSSGKSALVETVSANPSFFVYLPQTSAESAEFILQDTQSQSALYQKTVKLTKSGGVVRVALPKDNGLALEVGHQYHWSFTLLCDPEDASSNLFVEGIIQRVEPSSGFVTQVAAAQPIDQLSLYAANGYWFEALDGLAQLRQQQPQDSGLLQDWTDLLAAVKLDMMAQEPLLTNWSGKVSSEHR